jgi:site-specific recombinase XerD
MLHDLFKDPDTHTRYRSFSLFGTILDDFDEWLEGRGYSALTRQSYMIYCARIERYFQKRRVSTLGDLSSESFRKCRKYFKQREPKGTSQVVECLQGFLHERQLLPAFTENQFGRFEIILNAYEEHLIHVRGFCRKTALYHCRTGFEFLQIASKNQSNFRLRDLDRANIEKFIQIAGSRLSRGSLQHAIAHIRGLLRFLAMRGELGSGLDLQIDTPRTYRQEQLPKSIPWDVVCSFVRAIDRTSAQGLRDYGMFLLMTTYGLRGCDVAGLKLDDIDWRAGEIRFVQRKTKYPLVLPLVDEVGEALVAYLRQGRPKTANYRQIFLTLRAPVKPVTRGAIGEVFRRRVRRAKLPIPFENIHCLRHSFATHLLRQGLSLKAIGDVLGHHSTESTCVYLRLNTEELRDAALPLPTLSKEGKEL